MMKFLAIGAGGFIGAVLRYYISGWTALLVKDNFPLGTLVVNVVGSFLMGLLAGYFHNMAVNIQIKLFLMVGILGALTTFSTFSYQTLGLLQAGLIWKAGLNIIGSVILAMLAVYGGWLAGQALHS